MQALPEGPDEARVDVRDEKVRQPYVVEHRRDEVASRRLGGCGNGLEDQDHPHSPSQEVDVRWAVRDDQECQCHCCWHGHRDLHVIRPTTLCSDSHGHDDRNQIWKLDIITMLFYRTSNPLDFAVAGPQRLIREDSESAQAQIGGSRAQFLGSGPHR